jgi:hypothetical protein
MLATLGRHEEAAQAAAAALRLFPPYFERYPKTYGGLVRAIVADILRYSEAAGQAPDQALLEKTLKTTLHAVLEAAKIRDQQAVATLGPVLGELRSSWERRSDNRMVRPCSSPASDRS